MNPLATSLLTIEQLSDRLLTEFDGQFNAEQEVFIKHIRHTAGRYRQLVEPIPSDEWVLQRVIPILSDGFVQAQTAVINYAQLLVQHPEQFHADSVPIPAQKLLAQIVIIGINIRQTVTQIEAQSVRLRAEQRRADLKPVDLKAMIDRELPLYRYWLEGRAVQINAGILPGLPQVVTHDYHLSEWLQHVIRVLGHELIEYGRMSLTASRDSSGVNLSVFCTGVQLNTAEYELLFKKEGRYIYLDQLRHINAELSIIKRSGIGSILRLTFSTLSE